MQPRLSGPGFFIVATPALSWPVEKKQSVPGWMIWLCGLLFWFLPIGAGAANYSTTEIINATNSVRVGHQLPTLQVNEQLQAAATAKAQDMIARQYFNHYDPDGQAPWKWLTASGYMFTEAGENLAFDFIDGQDVVPAWLRSATHRANILSSKYTDVGVAVIDGALNGSPTIIVVQFFGRQTAAAAVVKKSTVSPPSPTPTSVPVKVAVKSPALNSDSANMLTPPSVPRPKPAIPSLVRGQVAPPNLTFTYELPSVLTANSLLTLRTSRVEGLRTSWQPAPIPPPATSSPATSLPALIFAALIGEGSVVGAYGLLRKQKLEVIHNLNQAHGATG